MAVNSTLINNSMPDINAAIQTLQKAVALPASGISNADNVQVFTFPAGSKFRISNVDLRVSATLGASATVQVQINRAGVRTSLTAATTAGAASKVNSDAQAGIPFDAQGGDILELLVGGANISSAATATLDIDYSARNNG